jgi:ABC-type spermidine/putrescine transport system permease subunit I
MLRAITNRLVILIPYIWLLFFFLLPFLIVLKIALSDLEYGQPPYAPQFSLADGWASYGRSCRSSISRISVPGQRLLYINSYLSSLQIAFVSTILTLLIGFPLAYGMARAPDGMRPTLLMLVILPFWTSFLIRVYAWIGILKQEGCSTSCCSGSACHRRRWRSCRPTRRSISASSIPTCPSWCCRSTRRSRRWTSRWSRRRAISAARASAPSGR